MTDIEYTKSKSPITFEYGEFPSSGLFNMEVEKKRVSQEDDPLDSFTLAEKRSQYLQEKIRREILEYENNQSIMGVKLFSSVERRSDQDIARSIINKKGKHDRAQT